MKSERKKQGGECHGRGDTHTSETGINVTRQREQSRDEDAESTDDVEVEK